MCGKGTHSSVVERHLIVIPPDTYIWGLYRSHACRWVCLSVCRSVGLWTFLVNTISQQPFVRIQYNFTRMIDTKPSCAYCRRVALELFLNEAPAGGIHHVQ